MEQPVNNPTSLQQLRTNAVSTAAQPVTMGFENNLSIDLLQRVARLLASSSLVPEMYRLAIEKTDRYGKVSDRRENPNAIPNCVIALNMSQRMKADPLMVMQNMHIIEGRPSWSSPWIIAAINGCGRFSPLKFDIRTLGKKTVEYKHFVWEGGQRTERITKVDIEDVECVAWTIEKATGERLESPEVSIEMAVEEGWYTKNGSKWKTMPKVMLRYRAASFFGKLHTPELLMGLQTMEEIIDMENVIDVEPDPTTVQRPQVDIGTLRAQQAVVVPSPVDVSADLAPENADHAALEQTPLGDWNPTPEEIEAIRSKEMEEAGLPPQDPPSLRQRRARQETPEQTDLV